MSEYPTEKVIVDVDNATESSTDPALTHVEADWTEEEERKLVRRWEWMGWMFPKQRRKADVKGKTRRHCNAIANVSFFRTATRSRKHVSIAIHAASKSLITMISGNALTDFFLQDVGITQNQYNVGQQLLSLGIVVLEVC